MPGRAWGLSYEKSHLQGYHSLFQERFPTLSGLLRNVKGYKGH